MKAQSRRSFIKRLAFGGVDSNDSDSILLLVFLRGGADTLNMVIPFEDDQYYRARPTIGLKAKSKGDIDNELAIKINDFYAFHPRMAPLCDLFREGRLSIVQAVGSDNVSGSHFEAQDQMEHGESFSKNLEGGWLGRYLFYKDREKSSPLAAVSLGNRIPESLRGAPSACAIRSIEDVNLKVDKELLAPSMTALSRMYGDSNDMLGHAGLDTLSALKKIETLKEKRYKPENGAQYLDDDFSKSLMEVARLIKAKIGLQIACVNLGGWDTHFIQGGATGLQAGQIDILARGLKAFDDDMKSARNKVTTLVMTEFGRRSYENSSLGTDHGRAFSMFIISDKIEGGKIFGNWPGISADGYETILGPAGLTVEIDYRDVLWEIVEGILGRCNPSKVFPDLSHKKINLVNGFNSF